jgi:protein DIA2
MMDMLQLLKNYNPGFVLNEFGFRDKIVEAPLNLNEFTTSDLRHLQSLKMLDLTGSSLTTKGFKKFIFLCNKKGNLRKLYIGESSNIYFPMDMFVRNRKMIRLYDILVTLPHLTHLYLNGLELDNYTMKQFWSDLQKLTKPNQLKVLDLSFCTKIDGMGLLQLFGATSTQNRVEPDKQLRLEMLILDGIEIKKQTLDLLCKHNYVKVIKCNPMLKKWKQFGETSWIV